jgi:excisionase family DNA binding protein
MAHSHTRGRSTPQAEGAMNAIMLPVPRLLSLVDVASALHVSPHTIRAWVKRGRLRPLRLCRRLLFHPDEIARFLSEATGK